jgi:hypothetical protein
VAKETYCFVASGSYGSGKSVLALSYKRPNEDPKRLVIDKEVRSIRYQSQQHGVEGDDIDKLLFEFTLYPDETGQISVNQFVDLVKKMKKGKLEYNILIVESMAMFQGDVEGWCQTSPSCAKVLKALDLDSKYSNFLQYQFKVGKPGWWNIVKDIVREFLLVAKRANMDIFITTELKNEWENFGVRGTAPDGKPWARIKGQTAKVWNFVVQIADVMWLLERKADVIKAKPAIQIDPLNPKLSIVGIPPTFEFESWEKIWELIESRGVPTSEDFEKVDIKPVEYREGDPDAEDDGVDPVEAGKVKLIEDLKEYGYENRQAVGAALNKLKTEYTLDKHDSLFADLVALKEN